MKVIDAAALDYKTLNEVLRQPEHDYVIEGCCGLYYRKRKCAGRRRRYDERRKDFDSWQRRRCGRIRYERR